MFFSHFLQKIGIYQGLLCLFSARHQLRISPLCNRVLGHFKLGIIKPGYIKPGYIKPGNINPGKHPSYYGAGSGTPRLSPSLMPARPPRVHPAGPSYRVHGNTTADALGNRPWGSVILARRLISEKLAVKRLNSC